jgi:hypothetical protein
MPDRAPVRRDRSADMGPSVLLADEDVAESNRVESVARQQDPDDGSGPCSGNPPSIKTDHLVDAGADRAIFSSFVCRDSEHIAFVQRPEPNFANERQSRRTRWFNVSNRERESSIHRCRMPDRAPRDEHPIGSYGASSRSALDTKTCNSRSAVSNAPAWSRATTSTSCSRM